MDSVPSSVVRTPGTAVKGAQFEWFLLHAGFVLIGVITASLGPLIPIFVHKWGISDAQAGNFFPAQYAVSTLGVISTSWLLPRFGMAKVLALGFLFLALGMGFLGVSPWQLTAFCVTLNGLGYGLCNPTTNLRGTQLPSKNVAGAVSLLNFSWGVGAVACPFIVAQLVPRIRIRGFGICIAVLVLALAVTHFFRKAPEETEVLRKPKHSLSEWTQQLRVPQAVPLMLLFFLYVGTEASFGGWVGALEKRLPSSGHASLLAVAPSLFYGFLLLGRGVAPLLLRHFSTLAIAIAGAAAAVAGGGVLALAPTQPLFLVGVGSAGLGCSSLYPIFITWLADIYRADADWIGAVFFAVSGLGGGTLPKLVGTIATASGSLRIGLLVPLAASVVMIFLSLRAKPNSRAIHP